MSLPPFKLTIPVAWIDQFHGAMLEVWGGPPPRGFFTDAPFLDELHEKLLCSANVTGPIVVPVPFDLLPLLHGFLTDVLRTVTTHTELRYFVAGLIRTVWREAHLSVVEHLARIE